MRHVTKNLVQVVIILVMTTGAGRSQEKPVWANDLPGLPNKPGYYQGLGSVGSTGDADGDWQKAAGRARSQIAQQIRVRIVNTVTRAVQETSSEAGTNLADAYASTTEQITDQTIEEVPIDRWFNGDEKVMYAYGKISQEEVEQRFRERLEGAIGSARIFYGGAKKAIQEGDVYLACTQLLEGVKVVSLAELYLNKPVMGELEGAGTRGPVLSTLQNEFCATLGKIEVDVTGGNDQSAERGRALAEPLVGRVVFRDGTRMVPVRNAILSAAFVAPAQGELTAESRTGSDGEFRFSVNEVKSGQAVSKIRVGVTLQGLAQLVSHMPDIGRCWTHLFTDFTFRMKTRTNVTIAMHVEEINMGKKRPKSTVQEEIQKRLIGDRYTLIEESKVLSTIPQDKISKAIDGGSFDSIVQAFSGIADLAIVGRVETQERGNPFPQMYFAMGTVVIRVVDVKTGQILASVNLENEKDGGPNYEVAGTRLLARLGKRIGDDVKREVDKALE